MAKKRTLTADHLKYQLISSECPVAFMLPCYCQQVAHISQLLGGVRAMRCLSHVNLSHCPHMVFAHPNLTYGMWNVYGYAAIVAYVCQCHCIQLLISCPSLLKFIIDNYGGDIVVLCARFQNEWTLVMEVMGQCVFARFIIIMHF